MVNFQELISPVITDKKVTSVIMCGTLAGLSVFDQVNDTSAVTEKDTWIDSKVKFSQEFLNEKEFLDTLRKSIILDFCGRKGSLNLNL